jgi:hypothetical protein
MQLCCTTDEGGPLGAGLQEQASNHRQLLWSKAMVVSVTGKGAARPRQVRSRETKRMNHRKRVESVGTASKPGRVVSLGQARGIPVYCPSGARHRGGVNLDQAVVRNVGTFRLDAKGEIQVEDPRG